MPLQSAVSGTSNATLDEDSLLGALGENDPLGSRTENEPLTASLELR